MFGTYDVVRFRTGKLALHEVDVDLISIEISVERVAITVVHSDGLSLRFQNASSQRHN